jgi:hypothetical protein
MFAEAEIAAKYLKPMLSRNDVIYVKNPADWPLYFYLWYHKAPRVRVNTRAGKGRRYFVINKRAYSIDDMTREPTRRLCRIGEFELYQSLN